MPTGTPVYGFRLTNSTGAVVELTNWGARWLSAIVPDKHGEMANVLVSPTDLLSDEFYMGAIVGRFANRIGDARLCIDGQTYELEKNDGQNRFRPQAVGLESFGRRRALHAAFPRWRRRLSGQRAYHGGIPLER